MANDYGSLQARIWDEIADTSLTAEVALAVQDAIKFYSREMWPFLDTAQSFNTVRAQQAYNLPADYKSMNPVMALVSGSFWKMTPRTFDYLRSVTVLTTTLSPPQDYAIYATQIWLYPIPDAVYQITLYYDNILTPLINPTDANIWTEDGEELTRMRAKALIYRNVIRDSASADEMQAEIDNRIYPNFRAGYNAWKASGKIMPTYL